MVLDIVLIGVLLVGFLRRDLDGKQSHDEVGRLHQVGIYLRIQGVARLTNLHVHTHHRGQRGDAAAESVARLLRSQDDRRLVYLGCAESQRYTNDASHHGVDAHLLAVSIQRPDHLGHIDIDELLLLFHKISPLNS